MASAQIDNQEPGSEARPIVIVALMLATALGDFIEYNLFAASFKRQYRHARLIAYYRRDRPFKDGIVEMNPEIDEFWAMDNKDTVETEYFNVAPGGGSDRHVDIILTPSMMHRGVLPSLPSLARFHIPAAKAQATHNALVENGIDPERWYCVLHYREPSYQARGANADRDIEPSDPIEVTKHIIETLGGQVVRIGHAEMAAFPSMAGFADLSRGSVDIQMQAAAVHRSRFFLELSPSGPMALALCFGVPVARCNALILAGPTERDSIVLNQHIVGSDGATVPIETCVENNLLNGSVMPYILKSRGFRFVHNSLNELKVVAGAMVEATVDCPAWRTPRDHKLGETDAANQISWPLVATRRHTISGYSVAASEYPKSEG